MKHETPVFQYTPGKHTYKNLHTIHTKLQGIWHSW